MIVYSSTIPLLRTAYKEAQANATDEKLDDGSWREEKSIHLTPNNTRRMIEDVEEILGRANNDEFFVVNRVIQITPEGDGGDVFYTEYDLTYRNRADAVKRASELNNAEKRTPPDWEVDSLYVVG
jgi:hypothetical protein